MTTGSRRQRQQEAILAAAAAGDQSRATALLAEHAIEFPEDEHLLDPVPDRASPVTPTPDRAVGVSTNNRRLP